MSITQWPRWADMPEFHQLPEAWHIRKLPDLVDITAGQSPSSETYNNRGLGMPFLQGNAEFGPEFPIADVWCTEPSKVAPQGSTLMSVRAPVGELNRADKDYAIGRGLASLQAKDIDPDFLYYGLHWWRRSIRRLGQGTTFEAVTTRQLKQAIVALPQDTKEQRRIASVIRLANTVFEKAQAELTATRRLKQALMQQLFTIGMPGRHTSFYEAKFGKVPAAWMVKPLGSLLKSSQYGLSESFSEAGTYQILRMNNIEDGIVHDRDSRYIELDEQTYEIYRLNVGDILFNRTNSMEYVGRVGIVDQPINAVFASYLVRLVADDSQISPGFLNFCLNSPNVKNRYRRYATPAVQQANINPRNLKKTPIAFPPLDKSNEQSEIVELLKAVDNQIQTQSRQIDSTLILKKSLLQNLLTGKVRIPEGAVEVV